MNIHQLLKLFLVEKKVMDFNSFLIYSTTHAVRQQFQHFITLSRYFWSQITELQGRSQGFEKGGSTKNFLSAPVSILAKSS